MKPIKPFLKRLPEILLKGWSSTVGPLNPNDEKFNVRTRFKLALLSFAVLTTVFIISFSQAIKSTDAERTQSFLDFAQHISYVLGAVVASYVGMESVFPSIGGYGWRGRGGGGYPHHREEKHNDKPVGPDADDAEVD